jgi:hypothetical protein
MDVLLKLTHAIHLADAEWSAVLRVMPNKLLKNHPMRARHPLCTRLAGHDLQG